MTTRPSTGRSIRSGTDLAASVDAGATQIEVVDPTGFAVNDTIIIFDAGPVVGGEAGEARSEQAQIVGIQGNVFTLTDELQNDYRAGYPTAAYPVLDPDKRGAAVVKAGTGVFDPLIGPGAIAAYGDIANHWQNSAGNLTGALAALDGGCFVELKVLQDGSGPVPYREQLRAVNLEGITYANVWFRHRGTEAGEGQDNYIGVFGISRILVGEAGEPLGKRGLAWTWTGVASIERDYLSAVANYVPTATAHEVGHLWNLQHTDGSHPDVPCHLGIEDPGPPEVIPYDLCLMDWGCDRTDEIMEFCLEDPHHVNVIRHAQDPL